MATTQTGRKLRVAWIATRFDYGDPSRGASFEEVNFRSALEGMGHDVVAFDFADHRRRLGGPAMNDALVAFVRSADADVAVFFLLGREIEPATIARITRNGMPTFNWFADDQWRFDRFSRHYAPSFTLVATTDPDAIPRYAAAGIHNVILSQWACNRYAYRRLDLPFRYDVSFIGQPYGERTALIASLRKAGIDARCFGFGWESGRLTHDQLVETFAVSRINLNFSKSWGGPWWRRHRAVLQIKGRVFEVPGCGGFLLTDAAPHLHRYFEPGTEVGVFHGGRGLVESVEWWLERESERRAAAEAAYERVMREHTYDHRFAAIFGAMGLT